MNSKTNHVTNNAKPHAEKILLLGSRGQLGQAFAHHLSLLRPTHSRHLIQATRSEADLGQPQKCLEFLKQVQPGVVLNAAAYTQVDLAEKEPDLAQKINAETPGLLAQWCAQNQIPFVHFSTDYVFSGEGQTPWNESDPTGPLSVYGRTKLEGENRILATGGSSLIFRTSWVYDHQGKNFLTTMLRLGQEREEIRVVNDQHGAPTYARDLASASWEILQESRQKPVFPTGIYHLCNSGETTWYEFAKKIFELLREKHSDRPLRLQRILPISSSEYPTPARRPQNSRLNTEKVQRLFGSKLPLWHDSLQTCMQEVQ